MEVGDLTHEEYMEVIREHKAGLTSSSGFSSRVYVGENVVIKEQILGFVDGEWHSLQLYREDIPGSAEIREKLLDTSKDVEFTQKTLDSIFFFRTHVWDSDEVQPMARAARVRITPILQDAFTVVLSHPLFRLGVTVQEPLHILWSSWKSDVMLNRIAKIGAKRLRG